MKRRTRRASLLRPLTLLPSPSQPSLFSQIFMTFLGKFSAYIEGSKHATVCHGGCTGSTAVRYGGKANRRSARRFVVNRRGPQRLTSTPVGAHGRLPKLRGPRRLGLKPPWATANGCQNCKILKPSYIFAK
jgi:hypothetical protein